MQKYPKQPTSQPTKDQENHVYHSDKHNQSKQVLNWRQSCSTVTVVVREKHIYKDATQWGKGNCLIEAEEKVKGGWGWWWGWGWDGRPLVSWLGRIQVVWDRSDLTQPSFSRTGHVRLDLSHTTDIIPLSGETTAHHHSTVDRLKWGLESEENVRNQWTLS